MCSSSDSTNSIAYYNGRVYTVNPTQPWAEAFIVSAMGTIEALGPEQEILAIAAARNLVRYDLQKYFVMPGIHDAHTHLMIASMQALNESSIGFDCGPSDIGDRLKRGACACIYHNVAGDWVVGNFTRRAFSLTGFQIASISIPSIPTPPCLFVRYLAIESYSTQPAWKRPVLIHITRLIPRGPFTSAELMEH